MVPRARSRATCARAAPCASASPTRSSSRWTAASSSSIRRRSSRSCGARTCCGSSSRRRASGTRLTLTQTLEADEAARNAAGWHVCLDKLAGEDTDWEPLYEEYQRRGVPAGAEIPGRELNVNGGWVGIGSERPRWLECRLDRRYRCSSRHSWDECRLDRVSAVELTFVPPRRPEPTPSMPAVDVSAGLAQDRPRRAAGAGGEAAARHRGGRQQRQADQHAQRRVAGRGRVEQRDRVVARVGRPVPERRGDEAERGAPQRDRER